MQLNMCKHCHKIFYDTVKTSVCKDCKQKDDELFERVKEYLDKYPNSNALQIAEGLDIEAYQILAFINEKKLTIVKGKFEQIEKD